MNFSEQNQSLNRIRSTYANQTWTQSSQGNRPKSLTQQSQSWPHNSNDNMPNNSISLANNKEQSHLYTNRNNFPPVPQTYNSNGTVTKINNECGLINNEVFFFLRICQGQVPKLGDCVVFNANRSTTGRFKWDASWVELMPQNLQNNLLMPSTYELGFDDKPSLQNEYNVNSMPIDSVSDNGNNMPHSQSTALSKEINLKSDDGRVRLSGAGRRRFKRLLTLGVPLKEARKLALAPIKSLSTIIKNFSQDDLTADEDRLPISKQRTTERLLTTEVPLEGAKKLPTAPINSLGTRPKNYSQNDLTADEDRLPILKRKTTEGFLIAGVPLEEARKLATAPINSLIVDLTADEDRLPISKQKMTESFQEATKSNDEYQQRVRLCGAARKRLKHFISTGMPVNEARKLVIASSEEKSSRVKRQKTDNLANQTISNKTCQGYLLVNIVPDGFPERIFSLEETKLVRTAVSDQIVLLKDVKDAVKPQFLGCTFKSGWLAFKCKDHATADWLKNTILTLKPWDGVNLRLANDKEIPATQIYIGYFPGDMPNSRILSLIAQQNDGYRVENWRVLNRRVRDATIELTLAIDLESARTLIANEGMISFEFQKLRLRASAKIARNRANLLQTTTAKASKNE